MEISPPEAAWLQQSGLYQQAADIDPELTVSAWVHKCLPVPLRDHLLEAARVLTNLPPTRVLAASNFMRLHMSSFVCDFVPERIDPLRALGVYRLIQLWRAADYVLIPCAALTPIVHALYVCKRALSKWWAAYNVPAWLVTALCSLDDKWEACTYKQSQIHAALGLDVTQYPDWAAVHGQFSALEHACKVGQLDDECMTDDLLDCAAAHGGTAMRRLREMKCPWSARVFATAVGECDLPTLQWMRDDGCQWNENAFVNAAWRGDIDVLTWLAECGCPYHGTNLMHAAGMSGDVSVIQWCSQWMTQLDTNKSLAAADIIRNYVQSIFAGAVYNNHANIIDWVHSQKLRGLGDAIAIAASRGHVTMMQKLHEQHYECDDYTFACAVACGHVTVVAWLLDHRCSHTRDTAMRIAVYNNRVACARFLVEKGFPLDGPSDPHCTLDVECSTSSAMCPDVWAAAALGGQCNENRGDDENHILWWLTYECAMFENENTMIWAAQNGEWDLAKWLLSRCMRTYFNISTILFMVQDLVEDVCVMKLLQLLFEGGTGAEIDMNGDVELATTLARRAAVQTLKWLTEAGHSTIDADACCAAAPRGLKRQVRAIVRVKRTRDDKAVTDSSKRMRER